MGYWGVLELVEQLVEGWPLARVAKHSPNCMMQTLAIKRSEISGVSTSSIASLHFLRSLAQKHLIFYDFCESCQLPVLIVCDDGEEDKIYYRSFMRAPVL